jgi:hypothetical protein
MLRTLSIHVLPDGTGAVAGVKCGISRGGDAACVAAAEFFVLWGKSHHISHDPQSAVDVSLGSTEVMAF